MKEYKLFIDTNIFLRFILKNHQVMHAECVSFFTSVKEKSIIIYTSQIVIAEVFWVLQSIYNADKNAVILAIRSLLRIKNLYFTELLNMELALDLLAENNIKFVDAIIASHAEVQTGTMAVVSYDKDFDKLGIKRLEPKDLI